jgi:hypothetical protein
VTTKKSFTRAVHPISSLVNPPATLAPPVARTTATVQTPLAPAASGPTGPSALMASLATMRPTQLAPATHPLVAPAAAALTAAQLVLLETQTTATVKESLVLAASGPTGPSALMASLATM